VTHSVQRSLAVVHAAVEGAGARFWAETEVAESTISNDSTRIGRV
jgi:hypothetical protein